MAFVMCSRAGRNFSDLRERVVSTEAESRASAVTTCHTPPSRLSDQRAERILAAVEAARCGRGRLQPVDQVRSVSELRKGAKEVGATLESVDAYEVFRALGRSSSDRVSQRASDLAVRQCWIVFRQ